MSAPAKIALMTGVAAACLWTAPTHAQSQDGASPIANGEAQAQADVPPSEARNGLADIVVTGTTRLASRHWK